MGLGELAGLVLELRGSSSWGPAGESWPSTWLSERLLFLSVVLSAKEGTRRWCLPEPLTPAAGPYRAWVADLTLGWALSGTGEEGGQATLVVVLRECVFGEGAGRAGLASLTPSRGRIRQDSVSRSGLWQPLPRFPVRCGPAVRSSGGDTSGCRDVVLDSGGRRPPPRSCREAGTGLWREQIPLALPLLPLPHPFSLCHSADWGAQFSSPCSGLVLSWEDYGK